VSANQASHKVNAISGQVDAKTKSLRLRLRTIARASFCLVGLETLSSFFDMPASARLGALAIALVASLIGIAAVLWLWRLDSKQ
jgi:hypothetical protein